MCLLLTLVTAGVEAEQVDRFMRAQGRVGLPSHNASIQRALQPEEAQFFTVGQALCDCHSVFARASLSDEHIANEAARERQKMERRGWSASKIKRALRDQEKASATASAGTDSFDFWAQVLIGLLRDAGAKRAGLLAHDYQKRFEDEELQVARPLRTSAMRCLAWRRILSSCSARSDS